MMYLSLVLLALLLGHHGVVAAEESSSSWCNNDDDEYTVSCRFKAPHAGTPASVAHEWHTADQALMDYIHDHVPAVLEHTGAAAFDEHLQGVQAVLRYWGAAPHVATAGLLHSIYGTEGFQGFSLPLSERAAIQSLIGTQAEWLCFVFCMVDRWTVDQTVLSWTPETTATNYTFYARPELGRFPIHVTADEWLDFVELSLADWLEQVEGAARKANPLYGWDVGQAYVYRRTAYHQMMHILAAQTTGRPSAAVAPQMYQAVMATESVASRTLVQRRTPPLSNATAAAHEALRAAGQDLPIDAFVITSMLPEELSAYQETCFSATA